MTEPLVDRLTAARKEFDERTKGGKGMEQVVRGFFLSIVFPQLKKAAEADEVQTMAAIVDITRTLVNILGLTREQIFPESEVVPEPKPN